MSFYGQVSVFIDMQYIKLSVWAKKQGISYKTAWRWFKAGILPVKHMQLPTGTILVEDKE